MQDKCWVLRFVFLIIALVLPISCAPSEEPVQEVMQPLTPAEPEKPQVGDWVLIPAGEFIMGSNNTIVDQPALNTPEHTVELPDYEIMVYEVTNGQWIRFMTEGEYEPEGNWRDLYSIGREDVPVSNLTFDDATAYCEVAGGRLPSEAEWEKAARGTEGLKYPWGDSWDPANTNCNEMGYNNIIDVGSIEGDKSPFGVYDMMGNVTEWTSERLRPYEGSRARGDNMFRQPYIAVRGGSYAMRGASMSTYTRAGYFAKSQYGIGFRCARDVEVEEGSEGQSQ